MESTVWTQHKITRTLSIASTHKDDDKRQEALSSLYKAGMFEPNDTIVENPDGTVTFLDGPKLFSDKCRRIMAGEDPFLFDEAFAREAALCKDCRHQHSGPCVICHCQHDSP